MSHIFGLAAFSSQCLVLICCLLYTLYDSVDYKVTVYQNKTETDFSINLTKIAELTRKIFNKTILGTNKSDTTNQIDKLNLLKVNNEIPLKSFSEGDKFVIIELDKESVAWLEVADINDGLVSGYQLIDQQSNDVANADINEIYVLKFISVSLLILAHVVALTGSLIKKRWLVSLHHTLTSIGVMFFIYLQSLMIAEYQEENTSTTDRNYLGRSFDFMRNLILPTSIRMTWLKLLSVILTISSYVHGLHLMWMMKKEGNCGPASTYSSSTSSNDV